MKKTQIKKRVYSSKEIADELGLSLNEFFQFAKNEGLLDSKGNPTEFAISSGFIDFEGSIKGYLNSYFDNQPF